MKDIITDNYKLLHGDCLERMKEIPDGSVDMVLCDPPYSITSSKWDKLIPFDLMWKELERIINGNNAIVLFGSEPFSSALRMSNIALYKYDWVWEKNNAVGFVNAKLKPMNKHEFIHVFSKGKTSNGNKNNMPYYPQGLIPFNKEVRNGNKKGTDNSYWRPSMKSSNGGGHIQEWTNYPTTVLKFDKVSKAVHPTQKPVALLEYLIKTYTQENETVLDFTFGSCSTGIACLNTNRKFIGIELDDNYFDIGAERMRNHCQRGEVNQ